MTPLEKALELTTLAHWGQNDSDGMPHILHCVEILVGVKHEFESKQCDVAQFYTLEELLIAACLHDSVEDSKHNPTARVIVTLDMIELLFGLKIRAVVDALTRRESAECTKCHKPESDLAHSHLHSFEPKKEFYRDSTYRAKENPGARFIKPVDLTHNLGRTKFIGEKQASWRRKLEYKYPIALRVLQSQQPTTWEKESIRFQSGKYYVADPDGKEKEISEQEAREFL